MIVDPDFLDHWRTQMLVDMLDDPCAPQYIIRLWGHCQNRRSWVFDDMPVPATKAICRFPGDSEEFEKALIDCGFLAREGSTITVVGWDEHNASLIANWTNGARGGRPKGSTKETRKKPMGKPSENPSDNPQETDKIGCDEIGLDKDNMSGGQQADSEPAIFELPTNRFGTTGETYGVTESKAKEWREAYPACDVMAELKKMKAWLNDNPKKRKTKQGMAKFAGSWLSRQQDKGGSGGKSFADPLSNSPTSAELRELQKTLRGYT